MTTYLNVYQEWDILKEHAKKDEDNKIQRRYTKTNDRPSFGFMLQQARIQKRLTTTDVANHVNITPKMISLYENDTETPNEDIAMALRTFLGLFT